MNKRVFCALVLLMAVTLGLDGKVRLPAIISDNMVLQQSTDVKLWGWADAGECVSISTSWGDDVVSVTADADGKWSVYVKTPGCMTGQSVVFTCSNSQDKITVENILIGEVWLASGQSNMEFEMKPHPVDKWMTGMYEWEKESADADYPGIHLFKVEEAWDYVAPREDCEGEWVVCSPEVAQTDRKSVV